MASKLPSLCHPEKIRKTADGRCDTCYRRDRYSESLEVRERVSDANKRWAEKRTDAYYAKNRRERRRRRARLAGAVSDAYSLTQIAERDGWRCGICLQVVGKKFDSNHPRAATVDHIVPLSDGGDDVLTNLQLAHRSCNSKKMHTGPGQLRLVG